MISSGGLRKHLIRGGIYASSARFITMISGLGAQIVIARLLGPERLGAFFLYLSITGVCIIFVKAGIDRALLRLVAEANGQHNWGDVKGLIRTGIIFVSIIGIVFTLLLYIFSSLIGDVWFGSSLVAGALSVGCMMVLLQGLQGTIGESFRGLHHIGRASYFQGPVSSGIFLLTMVVLFLFHYQPGLNEVVLFNVMAFFISVAIAGTLLIWLLMRHGVKTSRVDVRNILSISSPMLITSCAVFIFAQADVFILGIFMKESEVGYYGTASRLAGLVAFILLIINANIPPLMAELYKKGEIKKLEKITRSAAAVGLSVCMPLSIFLIFWGDTLLEFLYGARFVEGYTVLGLLTVGKFIHVSLGSSGMLLQMTGYHKTLMNISIFVAVLSIIGFLLVVRPYGKEGIAVVAAITLTVQNLMQLYYAKKQTGILTLPSFHGLFNR